MALVVSIGGVDYLSYVKFPDGLQAEQAGRNRIGTATIVLTLDAANAVSILDKDEVQVYLSGGTAQCFFGGFVSHRTTYLEKGTDQELWEIQCQDYNLLLDTLVSRGATAQAVNVSAGNFTTQLSALVLGFQKSGSVGNPPRLIDTTSYVTSLIDTGTTLPAFSSKGETLRQAIDRWLLVNVLSLNDTLRPDYHLTLLPDGIGGVVCALVMQDSAVPPTSAATFSDNPGVGEHGIFSFNRVRDGASLANRQQAFYGNPTVQVLTATDPTSTAALNPYVNHGLTGSKGYWTDAPIVDKESTSPTQAQARLDALVKGKSQPRETIEIEEHDVFVRPGDTVTVEFASEGLATDYSVVGVGVGYVTPTHIRYKLTLGLPLRELLEGEPGAQGPPVEVDLIPPDEPTDFALVSNLWDPRIQRAVLDFSWTASPSADVAGYELMKYASGGYTPVDVGEVTEASLEYPPNTSYEVWLRAYDGRRNYSGMVGPLTGTTARQVHTTYPNGSFEFADRIDQTLPLYHERVNSGGGAAVRTSVEQRHGTYSLRLTTSGAVGDQGSVRSEFIAAQGDDTMYYELSLFAKADVAGTQLHWTASLYDVDETGVNARTGTFTLTTSWQRYSIPVQMELVGVYAKVQLRLTEDVARTVYVDAVAFQPQTTDDGIRDANVTVSKLEDTLKESDLVATLFAADQYAEYPVPFDCEVLSATMLSDTAGSAVVDVRVDTYANYPPAAGDSICASAKPTLSSAQKSEDTTLTGWTTAITAGSIVRFYAESMSTTEQVTCALKLRRT